MTRWVVLDDPLAVLDDATNDTNPHSLRDDPEDVIKLALVEEIKQCAKESFPIFAMSGSLKVDKAKDATEVRAANRKFLGWSKYSLGIWHPIAEQSRIVEYDPASKKVKLKFRGKWSPLRCILDLIARADNECPRAGFSDHSQAQFAVWWTVNGKSFPFQRLPAELRLQIYHEIFTLQATPYAQPRDLRLRERYRLELVTGRSLLRTNRLLYREASNVLYRERPFAFFDVQPLVQMLAVPIQRDTITQLHIYMTPPLFNSLISWQGGLEFHPLRLLRQTQLKQITLTIPDQNLNRSHDHCPNTDDCRERRVNLLVRSVWQWVKGHNAILCGNISPSLQRSFDAKCAEEYKKYGVWTEETMKRQQRASPPSLTLCDYDNQSNKARGRQKGRNALRVVPAPRPLDLVDQILESNPGSVLLRCPR